MAIKGEATSGVLANLVAASRLPGGVDDPQAPIGAIFAALGGIEEPGDRSMKPVFIGLRCNLAARPSGGRPQKAVSLREQGPTLLVKACGLSGAVSSPDRVRGIPAPA